MDAYGHIPVYNNGRVKRALIGSRSGGSSQLSAANRGFHSGSLHGCTSPLVVPRQRVVRTSEAFQGTVAFVAVCGARLSDYFEPEARVLEVT